MTRHVDGAAQVERADRQAAAVQLRTQGLGYRAIAARIGISVSSAHQLVVEALAQIPAESVDQLRRVEGDRLDRITNALVPGVEAGDAAACSVAVRVSARRSALLGLDSPIRVEVEDTVVRMHPAMIAAALRPTGSTDEYLSLNVMTGRLVDPPPPELTPGPWDVDPPEIVEADA